MSEQTVYQAVGGTPWFVALIDRFYDLVATDVLLRPMYPDDLTESRDHMVKFLQQYWGGPTTYSEERGHPRLRMRHAPFIITSAERDAWLKHMIAAVHDGDVPVEIESQMVDYFTMAANHMINTA
ncbi:MAG: globin [Acidimicrobiales bacterium]|nr:globin [Acidimicrobiales bacterium]RZV43993.1 MAG: globin [Acidimicrobiales bacterium]